MAIGGELGNKSTPKVDEEELRTLIGRITDSDTFGSAPAMRTLLLYLWDHRGHPVGEYAIAVDALGRPADFDPKTDSTVRVHVARLRAKLKDFYEQTGEDFPLRLTIPRGRHDLLYEYRPAETASFIAAPPDRTRTYLLAVVAICVVLLAACVALLLQNRSLQALAAPRAPVPEFWQAFLRGGKPSLIVVPSPLHFYFREPRVYVRDLSISTFPNWPKSPLLSELATRWGPPEFAQTYVGAMEMTTGVRLLQYLEERASGSTLLESRRFSPESVAEHNTIFLGMPRTTAGYLDGVIEKMSFYLAEADPAVIRIRDAQGQAPSEFRENAYSTDRRIHPAIIAFLPPRAEGTRTILLLGRYLTGAATVLTSAEGLQAISEALSKAGNPAAWEMVVETEVFRDTVLKTRPVSVRPINPSFWKR